MFSTLGLFANLQCPQRDSCTRPNCLFSHNASSDLPPPITLRIPVDEPKVASTSSLPSPLSQTQQAKTVPAKRTVNSSPLRATGSPTLTPNEPPRKLQKLNPSQKRVVQTSTPVGSWLHATCKKNLTGHLSVGRSSDTSSHSSYFSRCYPCAPSSYFSLSHMFIS